MVEVGILFMANADRAHSLIQILSHSKPCAGAVKSVVARKPLREHIAETKLEESLHAEWGKIVCLEMP